MVKSLHRSLEAKLASIKDPEYAESDDDVDNRHPETISAKRAAMGKGGNNKRKQGRDKKPTPSQPPSANDDEPSTVIYLGHLPVGFEEREITVFLNQFGRVNRCRVSRSTKTGRSRCYAFVEFAEPEVARIVADTMSGYLLLEKRLVCHVLPRDKVDHELMFARPKRVPTKKDMQKKARSEMNKVRNADAIRGITARLVKREEMKRKKFGALGIEYDFPGYAASADAAAAAAPQPSATVTTGSKKDDDASSTKKKKKRKLSNDCDEGKDNAKSGDEAVKTGLESLAKKEKKSKKGGLKGKSGGEEERRVEIDAANDLAEENKKKKKSKKMDVKQKRGRDEKEMMESDEKDDYAEEKKKKSKNMDLKEKCGEEKDKKQGNLAANDRNEDAANSESAKKKASKRKSKTSSKKE